MNRRKPKVVIPQQVAALIATGVRVFDTITAGGSIIEGNPSAAPMMAALDAANQSADSFHMTVNQTHEESQIATAARNVSFSTLKDRLIQLRDFAIANGGGERSAAGLCGFEVVQTTSRSGNARVIMPSNSFEFLALSNRVLACVTDGDDAAMQEVAADMQALIDSPTAANEESILKR